MSEIQVGTCLLAPLEEMLLAEAGWRRAMQVFKIFFLFEDLFIFTYFVKQALALLCSLCVICGATISRPEGFAHSSPLLDLDLDLEPDNDLNTTTSGSEQHSHRDSSGRRGLLVLLLGSDLASSPLLRFNIDAYLRQ